MNRWVLVTRSDDELGPLRAALSPVGFQVVALPVLRERPFDDDAAWEQLESRLSSIRWIALTSPRAPQGLCAGAGRRRLWDVLRTLPTAAVGKATAAAAGTVGLDVRLVGDAGGEALADALHSRLRPGDAVLHPCGREHRLELSEALARHGVAVLPVAVYAMEPTPLEGLPALPDGLPMAVVLTSPRAAEAYRRATGTRLAAVPHLAFGPTTGRAAARLGIAAVTLTQPTPHTILEELCQICS